MTIMTEVVECLRKGGYTVFTTLMNKTVPKQLCVLLDTYEPTLETSMSYTPHITYSIVFYMDNSLLIEEQITDIIKLVHSVVVLYPHMKFADVQINPTENDIEVIMKIQHYKVIDLG
jgi:hypothetical protein